MSLAMEYNELAKRYKGQLRDLKQMDINDSINKMSSSTNARAFWSCLKKAEELLCPKQRVSNSQPPLAGIETCLKDIFSMHDKGSSIPCTPSPDQVQAELVTCS